MRNLYPGTYLVCDKPVPAGQGWFQKNVVRKRPPGCETKRGSGVPTATVHGFGKWLLGLQGQRKFTRLTNLKQSTS